MLKKRKKVNLLTILLGSILAVCHLPLSYAEEYSPYGVMAHFERGQFYSEEEIHQACQLMQAAGVQWVLTCFNWMDIEPEKGKLNFTLTDRVVKISASYNLNLLPMLWYCPNWASTIPQDPKEVERGIYPPRNADEFANFCYKSVERYKGKIKYWLIWGEQNMPANWRPKPDVQAYFNLLKAAYKKIKQADPKAQVVLGSLALKNIESYLERLYRLGAKEYFDVVAINPYVHPTLNYDPYLDKYAAPIELVKDWVFKLRQKMSEYGDHLKPLWITEIGSPGQDQPGKWWLLQKTPTKQEQAQWLETIYATLLSQDLVDKIFWYNFRTPPDELSAQAGLVDIDFKIKPSYLAYQALPKLKQRQGLNVVLISVDCLRPDHLSCYGYRKNTSPSLDKLAQQGVRFTQCISVAPWTSPSLISLLTSSYPPVHGIDGRSKSLSKTTPTPIKKLKQAGYLVPGISYIHTVWNYHNLGFDVVKEPTEFEQKDEQLRINQWLDHNYRNNFFLWHHFYTPHLPYNPLPKYEQLFVSPNQDLSLELKNKLKHVRTQPVIRKGEIDFKKQDLGQIIALYDAEIRQLDAQIEAVISKLKALGILDKTIVIITSDHGEEFLEHGVIGHASTTLAASLYEECIRIPLIIYGPKVIPQGKVITQQIQNIDVMPTIFALLNLKLSIPVEGKNLLPLMRDRQTQPFRKYAFSDTTLGGFQSTQEQQGKRIRSIRTEDWKLIYHYAPENEAYLLFDLQNDSAENNNVIKQYPAIAQVLIARLRKWSFDCSTKKSWFQGWDQETEQINPQLSSKIEPPQLLLPGDNSTLLHQQTKGEILLKWRGDPQLWYTVEYDVGEGNLKMQGNFAVKGTEQVFGPLPEDVWNLLPTYNPWKLRVGLKDRADLQSNWIKFNFSSKRDNN